MTKKKSRRTRKNKQHKAPKSELVHLIASFDGSPPVLDDDCPLCRMLRETDEPVFTLDPFGNLSPFGQN